MRENERMRERELEKLGFYLKKYKYKYIYILINGSVRVVSCRPDYGPYN